MLEFLYKIVNIHIKPKNPSIIYASVVDYKNQLCVKGTFSKCVKWIEDTHIRLYSKNKRRVKYIKK